MRAGVVLDNVIKTAAPSMGQMALALEVKKPIPKWQVDQWAHALKNASHQLEQLSKATKS